jgi:phospholipase C
MDILTKNPEIWKKTIFILTYDENDGYFDHAPSFVAADPKRPDTGGASDGIDTGLEYTYKEDELRQGVAEAEARSGPIGMGFRVPMIVASPWSRGGWINSQLFDHTSTLMFLERFIEEKCNKIVREENISAWRRAVSGDLTSCFRPFDTHAPALDFLNRDKFVAGIDEARLKDVPSNYRRLTAEQISQINRSPMLSELVSRQEKGIRPMCAHPYELYADGNLSEDGTFFELRLSAANQAHGTKAIGAPFNVYLRLLKDPSKEHGGMIAATYAVKPGDTVVKHVPGALFIDNSYSIEVHAPNGFYRSFTGKSTAQAVELRTSYELKGNTLTGNVLVHLRNKDSKAIDISIQDNSYKLPSINTSIGSGQETAVVLDLQKTYGWYDFTVHVDGSESQARFAGRVETGRPGFSDPLMGGVV